MAQETILIIDDDEAMVALGRLILEKEGYHVLSAGNGPAGLALLRQQPVNLILLDIMMDHMNGWQVLEQIKQDKALRKIPVIMLTARHYLEDQTNALIHQGQFESYIVKPFIVRELMDEIKQVFAKKQPRTHHSAGQARVEGAE